MKLKYKGPQLLAPVIENEVDKAKELISRQGNLHLIVGGIEKLSSSKNGIRIQGCRESSNSLDEVIKELIDNAEHPLNYQMVIRSIKSACYEASFLPSKQYSIYCPIYDFIALSPYLPVNFLVGATFQTVLQDSEKRKILDVDNRAKLLFYAVFHEMLHWDLGETKCHTDLRTLGKKLGASYDKKRDGKLYEDGDYLGISEEVKEKRVQEYKMLVECWKKIAELGIFEFDEAGVILCSLNAEMPNPEHQLRRVPEDLLKMIAKAGSGLGPKEFMAFMKGVMDQSYTTNTHVNKILASY